MKRLNFCSTFLVAAIAVCVSGFSSNKNEASIATSKKLTSVSISLVESSPSGYSPPTFKFYQNGSLVYTSSVGLITIPAGTYTVEVSYSGYSPGSFYVADDIHGIYSESFDGNPASSTPIYFGDNGGYRVEWHRKRFYLNELN